MFNKDKLIYTPSQEGDIVGSYLKAADGDLLTKTNINDKKALDVNVTGGSINVFTKPYDSIIVLSKNEDGDPLTLKSSFGGNDVQLVTFTYDVDGDFQSLVVSDY